MGRKSKAKRDRRVVLGADTARGVDSSAVVTLECAVSGKFVLPPLEVVVLVRNGDGIHRIGIVSVSSPPPPPKKKSWEERRVGRGLTAQAQLTEKVGRLGFVELARGDDAKKLRAMGLRVLLPTIKEHPGYVHKKDVRHVETIRAVVAPKLSIGDYYARVQEAVRYAASGVRGNLL